MSSGFTASGVDVLPPTDALHWIVRRARFRRIEVVGFAGGPGDGYMYALTLDGPTFMGPLDYVVREAAAYLRARDQEVGT
jgi:hypothetical protein